MPVAFACYHVVYPHFYHSSYVLSTLAFFLPSLALFISHLSHLFAPFYLILCSLCLLIDRLHHGFIYLEKVVCQGMRLRDFWLILVCVD
ncbi:hypothetical protein FN846DRAFT_980873 [Sphaerosporella brunnea]|uniref:Uncharacterized protein n=1 Tax=Sphaerosporella brunnea TaxID=1250544 RepID=A0A5J5ED50_9PEZI|nr:hypothetical protein FN846DRAFT_980873 [Sphaerosporella brunnea]